VALGASTLPPACSSAGLPAHSAVFPAPPRAKSHKRARAVRQATLCPNTPLPPDSSCHKVTVTFNYDFTRMPSCPAPGKNPCIAHFHVYDISGGTANRVLLFSFDPSPGETKLHNGLTGSSPLLLFETGKHELGVTAETNQGGESAPGDSITWIDIPPPSAPSSASPSPPSSHSR